MKELNEKITITDKHLVQLVTIYDLIKTDPV